MTTEGDTDGPKETDGVTQGDSQCTENGVLVCDQNENVSQHSDLQGAACNFQACELDSQRKDLQGAACNFQECEENSQNSDPQGAACDSQTLKTGSHSTDLQGAACNFQPQFGDAGIDQKTTDGLDTCIGDATGVNVGAIPKRKAQKAPVFPLGKKVGEDILNTTPVRLNSPKQRLIWSPETPTGRSRKYSINDKEIWK